MYWCPPLTAPQRKWLRCTQHGRAHSSSAGGPGHGKAVLRPTVIARITLAHLNPLESIMLQSG